jgi:hypothetical protein
MKNPLSAARHRNRRNLNQHDFWFRPGGTQIGL